MPLFSKNSLILRLVPPNLLIFYFRTIVTAIIKQNHSLDLGEWFCFKKMPLISICVWPGRGLSAAFAPSARGAMLAAS